MITTACFLCNNKDLYLAIDLGFHPLADTFLKPDKLTEPEPRYPLNVVACKVCGHLMNGYIVPATARYQENEYSYDSSNSTVAITHFEEFAKEAAKVTGLKKGDLVVDVGSNVGTFLEKFRDASGCDVIGVEPAANIAKIAEKNSVPTINNFFNEEAVKEILKTAKAKLITGTNVYNHIEDQEAFAKNVDALLAEEGSLIVETPYAGTLVDEISFDTIYLEHASYFFVAPMKKFWERYGFKINKVVLNDYMGGSIQVYVSRHLPEGAEVAKLIKQEEAKGYFKSSTYKKFNNQVVDFKMNLMKSLYDIKSQGGVIIGIGAATKGNTLLNYCGIDSTLLEYVTDASPLKIGKFTPGSHIPIKDDKDIDNKVITHGVILPWNIGDFLSKKLSFLGIEFIVPHLNK
jgi:2-polyprenyl-3-methyl-5-hydroxy-6-metoxy-1,4-benzoquinol methylase